MNIDGEYIWKNNISLYTDTNILKINEQPNAAESNFERFYPLCPYVACGSWWSHRQPKSYRKEVNINNE